MQTRIIAIRNHGLDPNKIDEDPHPWIRSQQNDTIPQLWTRVQMK